MIAGCVRCCALLCVLARVAARRSAHRGVVQLSHHGLSQLHAPALHARAQIRELDKMIAGMKKNRATAQDAMDEDAKRLAALDDEIGKIDRRYQKLVTAAADRKQRYLALKSLHERQFDSLTVLTLGPKATHSKTTRKAGAKKETSNSVRATLTKASRLGSRMQSKEAASALYNARHRTKMQGRKVSGASMRLTTGAKAKRMQTALTQEQADLLATVCAANGVKVPKFT